MAKNYLLYELIHSLSKSEKRYFKLFCQREASGAKYLTVFGVFEKQPVYQAEAIKHKLQAKNLGAQLHVTKNYLRQLILKSLRNFHSTISKDAEVKALLQNVEILFHKELFKLCSDELAKAERLCHDYELLGVEYELFNWKRKLAQAINPGDFNSFEQILSNQKTGLEKMNKSNELWQLGIASSKAISTGAKNPKVQWEQELKTTQTLDAKVMFYYSWFLHLVVQGESAVAEEKLIELLTLLEAQPNRLKEEAGWYVSTLNNLLSLYAYQKKIDLAFALINKAKKVYDGLDIKTENKGLLKQVLRTYNLELEIVRSEKLFEDRLPFIERTEEFVNQYQGKMPIDYLHSFWFQFASIHFMRKDYSKSLNWINKLLNTRAKNARIDLQITARMLNLMVHLEQQNLFVLRYFVDSAKRYFKKQKQVQEYEKVLLQFFITMGRLPLLEYKQAYRALKHTLFPEEGKSLVPEGDLQSIDFKSWLETKV